MTIWLRRPWGQAAPADRGQAAFEAGDCLLAQGTDAELGRIGVPVLQWRDGAREVGRYVLAYPVDGVTLLGARLAGFPRRWPLAREPETPDEAGAALAVARMKSLMSRVQEVEAALDQPAEVWERLREAWLRASEIDTQRLSEIVRQSRPSAMPLTLARIEPRLRRVLRRVTELTPLGRVEEVDRKAMIWLSRQPGDTMAERAGSRQRIMATARHQNFDTVENRVLHAYARTASIACRAWVRENAKARRSDRYGTVALHDRRCLRLARHLAELGVGVAAPDATPNFVLAQDRDYRATRDAWLRLLREEHTHDDYWAWQAQSWIDFTALAVVLSLLNQPGAVLVSQSPIRWLPEPERGRWFEQDNPLAVVWLRDAGVVVDVQSRPSATSEVLGRLGAPLSLLASPVQGGIPSRFQVWPRHQLRPTDPSSDLPGMVQALASARGRVTGERLEGGLVVVPGFEAGDGWIGGESRSTEDGRAALIAVDLAGPGLARGLHALASAIARLVAGAAA